MKRIDIIKHITNWWLNEDRTEEGYDKSQCKTKIKLDYATVLQYLEQDDVQSVIKQDYKNKSLMRMLEIYESHLDKAKKGDVNSAKFVMDFFKSDIFTDTKSEVDKILETLKG